MGFLHDGHLSLIRTAKKKCDIVVVSIFVNPTQFGPSEDFARYPRDLKQDSRLAQEAGCDILFVPDTAEIYNERASTFVVVEGISAVLEGRFRPTHFQGVTTIVCKLFNIVHADKAFFGQKDAQQCVVVKKMVKELNIPVEIEIVPTVREMDGLAKSSRNIYLSPEERLSAPVLFQSLRFAGDLVTQGETDAEKITSQMKQMIMLKNPSAIDYGEIVDADSLEPVKTILPGKTILVVLAVRFGTTRLIDNIILTT
jgi:pantoate--beta-alanine ligase